jgi:CRISPR-associated endonuclease/helicase Cas3
MPYCAHSGRLAWEGRPAVPPQTYADHVTGVVQAALRHARDMAGFLTDISQRKSFIASVYRAALAHDIGKLLPENAAMLSQTHGKERPSRLETNHVDAGVAFLLEQGDQVASLLAWAHHVGLDDQSAICKLKPLLRDPGIWQQVDNALPQCKQLHAQELGALPLDEEARNTIGFSPRATLDYRLALSCLVDADHSDTARHYGQHDLPEEWPLLRANERLATLDAYVEKLGKDSETNDERNAIRTAIYRSARTAPPDLGVRSCDSPVGTGKTTSVMAHLLHVATANKLRRIFVVLPFTNIIDQAVEVYRKALVLEGEDPERVVAAHHHRAEFDSPESRALTYLWRAPIIVVTAVQFFETLAAASTAALRKLHCLPGSAIFVDEAHAAMPADLWLPAWVWLRVACQRWNCHWVLASGSLTRFWELEHFRKAEGVHSLMPLEVSALVPDAIRNKAAEAENLRVRYVTIPHACSMNTLVRHVIDASGPRIVVMNTVRGAALLALRLATQLGRTQVEHLSTALCPRDRAKTLRRVKQRLRDTSDTQWVLVATSCVEAGVNFSFRTGFRERFGLCNLLQLGGRVCREAEAEGVVYDFVLLADELHPHPGARYPARALASLFHDGLIGPEHCREALRRELNLGAHHGGEGLGLSICTNDAAYEFRDVQNRFRLIASETVTVIVDASTLEHLRAGYILPQRVLQETSVQIWSSRLDRDPIVPVEGWPQLYAWQGCYDDFLGYLAEAGANL